MPDAQILEQGDLPGAAAAWQLSCPVCSTASVEQGLRSGADHTAVTIQSAATVTTVRSERGADT
jgi:hypothetical protein